MCEQENHPEVLVSVPSDLEAAMIVSALAAQDIDATTTGSYTAGFRAEAPGEVQVLVRNRDLSEARTVLSELAEARPRGAGAEAARPSINTYLVVGAFLLLAVVGLISSM